MSEAHARPYYSLPHEGNILHVAFKTNRTLITGLSDKLGLEASEKSERFSFGELDQAYCSLEHHTEFLSLTLFGSKAHSCEELLGVFKRHLPVSKIDILVLLKVRSFGNVGQLLKATPKNTVMCGGSLKSVMEVRSTYKLDSDGAIEYLLHTNKQTSDELGRRVKRLLDMETYRTLALLGLPLARSVSAKLSSYEGELAELGGLLRTTTEDNGISDQALFDRLMALSEKNNELRSESRYRFSASRAYYDLFLQRIETLEEQADGDLQTMTGFLRSRADPAIATIDSTVRRQAVLTDDISRTLSLLRTRIELALNRDNQRVLASMEKRHAQHLKIARSVEGLSVVAISYYAVGLISYFTKAADKQEWLQISGVTVTAMAVPAVVLAVWLVLHKLKDGWRE